MAAESQANGRLTPVEFAPILLAMNQPIEYLVEDDIAVLTINRPEARNALNWSAQQHFAAGVERAAADATLRVLIITAVGDKAFASGGDIKELVNHPTREDALRLRRVMGDALTKLTQLPLPVIAAVNGDAVGGGCEIMSACDLRLAAESARFQFAQVQVGLTTGWGGAARLIHLIGAARALELMMTGRFFDATEAAAMGFVQRLAPADEVLEQAKNWASKLKSLPSEALAAIKRLSWEASGMSLEESYQLEESVFVELWPKRNHLEAMNAFIEKRPPKFGGR
jgi:enoyl-CoA hydratase